MVSEAQIREALTDVLDPEIQIDIVNLGMVYGVDVAEGGKNVTITVTLTTMGCPLYDEIKAEIVDKVASFEGVENVTVDLTFDPPWDKDMMSEEAKLVFRYLF